MFFSLLTWLPFWKKVHDKMVPIYVITPLSKRMAQNLDLCHLLCIRTHVKTHLRHLPQNYLTTDKGSTAQGEKILKNLVIQKRIFRWHLRHLLWLAWFPSKKILNRWRKCKPLSHPFDLCVLFTARNSIVLYYSTSTVVSYLNATSKSQIHTVTKNQ